MPGQIPIRKVYFIGINDIGMSATARLAKRRGFDVSGSFEQPNPLYDRMLAEEGIDTFSSFDPARLSQTRSDLVVIANGVPADNPEVEFTVNCGLKFTSFPKFLGTLFFEGATNLVVVGTHGKSTTTALLTRLLEVLGESPSYFIGAVRRDNQCNAELRRPDLFVIEGDEYGSAFFDPASKFLHYRPTFVVLNNIEFDHSDLFPDLDSVLGQFKKLVRMVDPSRIIANPKDPGVRGLLTQLEVEGQVHWSGGKDFAYPPLLAGAHNRENFDQAMAAIDCLARHGTLRGQPDAKKLSSAMQTFEGVHQRLECKGRRDGVEVFHDFAHHPTAIRRTLEALKEKCPAGRVVVAFNPATYISRDPSMRSQLGSAFARADSVALKHHGVEGRWLSSSELIKAIGPKATHFKDPDLLLAYLVQATKPGDQLLFMSTDSFDKLPERYLAL